MSDTSWSGSHDGMKLKVILEGYTLRLVVKTLAAARVEESKFKFKLHTPFHKTGIDS